MYLFLKYTGLERHLTGLEPWLLFQEPGSIPTTHNSILGAQCLVLVSTVSRHTSGAHDTCAAQYPFI